MKTYLNVLQQNSVALNNILQTRSHFFKTNLKSFIHPFKLQDDLTAYNFVSNFSNLSSFNFKKLVCEIKTSLRFKEFIPEPIF